LTSSNWRAVSGIVPVSRLAPGDDADLAVVVAQQVGNRVADRHPQGAAFDERVHDVADVVLGEDHIGGVAGRGGAAGPEGDADVGEADCGGVADAVAGHGDAVAQTPVGGDEPRLVGGGDAGAHGQGGQEGIQGFVRRPARARPHRER
jgi:hypothetical protein